MPVGNSRQVVLEKRKKMKNKMRKSKGVKTNREGKRGGKKKSNQKASLPRNKLFHFLKN